MWQKGYVDQKQTFTQAVAAASSFSLAGHDDWRLPTVKELYSLIVFVGKEPNPDATDSTGAIPFIDDAFDFRWGDTSAGERVIDSQYITATEYTSTTMNGDDSFFGVNFADGRIKGYPTFMDFETKYVRDNTAYGTNDFADNSDQTITDAATGLMWEKSDSGQSMNWEDALAWVLTKNGENHLGYSDWRLPNIKEMQSIVDYTRSPDYTNSPAIDPIFNCTTITNEAGVSDYPFYWSGTTHLGISSCASGAYVAFGECLGKPFGSWIDVHGAGAQRSDPKDGDPSAYPDGFGPQGDSIRILNYIRLVRDAD